MFDCVVVRTSTHEDAADVSQTPSQLEVKAGGGSGVNEVSKRSRTEGEVAIATLSGIAAY